MSRVHVTLNDAGIEKAIRFLEDLKRGRLVMAADKLAGEVALAVQEDMRSRAHYKTGKLQGSLDAELKKPEHPASGRYRVVADPEDHGFHYAETERSRGGGHDFTAGVKKAARDGAKASWDEVRRIL